MSIPNDYVSEADLSSLGLTAEDVRKTCPNAVELSGNDGCHCWARADLTALLGEEDAS